MSRTLEITKDLINRKSVTPEDAGCQEMMANVLTPLGFEIEDLTFADTKNIWARRGTEEPLFCFAGHTDVVPSGPEKNWQTRPHYIKVRLLF
jgi:succinyl-diaminopimelate desuccinylase